MGPQQQLRQLSHNVEKQFESIAVNAIVGKERQSSTCKLSELQTVSFCA